MACSSFTLTGWALKKSNNPAERRALERLEAVGHAPFFLEQRYVAAHPIDDISEHPANPNEGDIGEIHSLIDANGFYGAIIVQEKTPTGEPRNRIVVGNHRHRTLKQKGKKVCPVFLCTMDDERALRILLGDNRARDKAGINLDTLSRTLQSLNGLTGSLRGTGYDEDDLQDTLKQLSARTASSTASAARHGNNPWLTAEKDEAKQWPVIKIRVPPDVLESFTEQMGLEQGKPWERLAKLLERASYSDNG